MMDYYLLADLAARLGCQLALAGAETFRVEDTVRRLLDAYGVHCEVFAIPNSLTVSFEAANGKPLTILKRIGYHGNDLEALEQLNALSRCICREKPTVEEASEWLRQTMARCRVYRPAVAYLGSGYVMPLYNETYTWLLRPTLTGLQTDGMGVYYFQNVVKASS